MRDFKFRAWDKTKRQMIGPFVFGSFVAGDGFDSDWEVLQFTGILDKSGGEVYEGDYVRYPSGKLTMVTWEPELYAFSFGTGGCITDQEDGCVENGQVVVVGNIYEGIRG